MTTENNKPLQRLEISPLVATIWAREATTKAGETFTAYNVDIQRCYKHEASGEFRYTKSFRPHDLANLAILANMADSYLKSIDESKVDEASNSEAA